MGDIITLLSALILGYICFIVVILFLGRLFFPFLTKDQVARLKKQRMNLKKHKVLMGAR